MGLVKAQLASRCPTQDSDFFGCGGGGRDRDRTDDLYRVKVALVPTELRARLRLT